jgi:DNA polymerase-4
VQPASIDEFYLDLAGTERLFRGESLEATAARIRDTVHGETRIEVSVGGGPTRLLAKLAVGRAKPHGVFIVQPGTELDFMRQHDLSQLPGVGPSLARALEKKGLRTVTDALAVEEEWLKRWFGEQRGHWLHRRIRGIDGSRVRAHEPRKSISSERTFFQDIDDQAELEKRLRRLAGSVARTLRSKELRTRTVTVKIRDADFTTRSGSSTLPEPVESDAAIVHTALDLLADLRRKRARPVRLLGVGVTNLIDRETPHQLTLFDTDPATAPATETERDRTVSRVIDDLRDRFGHDSIGPGGTMDPPGGR